MANSRKAHKVSSHAIRARKSGRALAKIARNRTGPRAPVSVDGFIASIEQYEEAARELEVPEQE